MADGQRRYHLDWLIISIHKPLYFSIELGLTYFCSLLMLKTNKQEKMTRAGYPTFPIFHFYGINGI